MKAREALLRMKECGLIDDGEVYAYGQKPSALGGAFGAAQNLVLLCEKEDVLRVFDAKIDNSWSSNILTAKKEELSGVKVKNGFLGLQKKLYFSYGGQNYLFLVPFGHKKLVAYFRSLCR